MSEVSATFSGLFVLAGPLVLILIPLVAFAAFWSGIYYGARKAKRSKVKSLLFATLGASILFFVLADFAIQCDISFYVRRELEKSLSRDDFSSLKGHGLICPVAYSYLRDGKPEGALGVGGIRGAKIYYENEKSRP